MAATGLRRYPDPGKYEGGLVIDEYLHRVSLNGSDEELGESEDFGWYGLFKVEKGDLAQDIAEVMEEDKEKLTKEEESFLRNVVGAIICENSQGFVDVTWFTNKRTRDEAWKKLEEDYEEFQEAGASEA